MIHWQYKTQIVRPTGGTVIGIRAVNPQEDEVSLALNKLGEDGWELVSVLTDGLLLKLVLKRPKP